MNQKVRSGNSSSNASSRNAVKHGLAAAKWVESEKERIATLAELFKEARSGTRIEQAAKRAAEAREYLEQVIAARDRALAAARDASQESAEGAALDVSEELAACFIKFDRLERYERRATVQWEKALAELEFALLDN
jgi:hypothetical protein